jgi:(hydroxyamino)benzene mutase
MSKSSNRLLLVSGALLFLIGLLSGFMINALENSRMGLSAHLAALQGAIFLLVVAATWEHVRISEWLRAVTSTTLTAGIYLFWIALMLAAVWGTSEATPIAGAGFSGSPWQESAVMILLSLASLSVLVGTILLLVGFCVATGSRVPT